MEILTPIFIIVVLAIVLAAALLWRSRTSPSRATIGTYDEVKRQIQEGTATPLRSQAPDRVQNGPSWSALMEIPDPFERYWKLNEFAADKAFGEGFESLTPAERLVFLISNLETEVNNGGFEQFFFNTSGDYAFETVEALQQVGSVQTLDLLQQAIAVFGDAGPSADRDERWEQMEALPDEQKERWEQLDGPFFELEEPLYELVVNHLATQP